MQYRVVRRTRTPLARHANRPPDPPLPALLACLVAPSLELAACAGSHRRRLLHGDLLEDRLHVREEARRVLRHWEMPCVAHPLVGAALDLRRELLAHRSCQSVGSFDPAERTAGLRGRACVYCERARVPHVVCWETVLHDEAGSIFGAACAQVVASHANPNPNPNHNPDRYPDPNLTLTLA